MSRNACEIPKQDSVTQCGSLYYIEGGCSLLLSPPFPSVFTTSDPCSQPRMVIMGYHRVGTSRARERQARVGR